MDKKESGQSPEAPLRQKISPRSERQAQTTNTAGQKKTARAAAGKKSTSQPNDQNGGDQP